MRTFHWTLLGLSFVLGGCSSSSSEGPASGSDTGTAGDTATSGDTAVGGDTATSGDTAVGGDTATSADTATSGDTATSSDTSATGACSCNDTASSYCSEYAGGPPSLKIACDGMKSGCTKVYADTPCPTASEVGRCVQTTGTVTGATVFYTSGGMPWTADRAKGNCTSKQTWTPK